MEESPRGDQEPGPVEPARRMWMPWFPEPEPTEEHGAFLVQTRMRNRSGSALLIDPGAFDDLAGEQWIDEHNEHCRQCGVPEAELSWLEQPLNVGGVGKGA